MNPEGETSSAVEADAEQARAGLVGTLNQLRDNLKPANVVDEVMTNAKVGASAISDQILETARKNPLPALLIGAGVAMLLGLGQRTAGSGALAWRSKPRQAPAGAVNRGPEFAAHVATPSEGRDIFVTSRARQTWSSLKDQASDTLDSANQRLSEAAARSADTIGALYRSSINTGDPMSTYTRSRDQLNNTLARVLEEQPLVLAAIGVAVGAAIGAAIPQTEVENNLMGESSGTVRDAAQTLVQDQYTQLKSAAAHAVDDIKQTVSDRGINADNLSGLAQEIGEKAKTATFDAAKTLDPTA